MLQKSILAFIVISLLMSASYPESHIKGKIRTVYMNKWRDTLTYQYDAQGRVTGLIGIYGFETTFEYKGNTIAVNTNRGNHLMLFLNVKGLVDSLVDVDSNRTAKYSPNGDAQINLGVQRYFPFSGNYILSLDKIAGVTTHGIISFSKKFIYDDAGFIREEIVYINGGRKITSKREVREGNLLSYSVVYPIDTVQMVNPQTMEVETKIIRQNDFLVKNTFDPGKTNTLASFDFFGKSSKNILIRSVDYDLLAKDDSTVITFKYKFDSETRVSTLITSVRNNEPPDVKEYTERPDTCYFTYY